MHHCYRLKALPLAALKERIGLDARREMAGRTAYAAPETEIETALAEIWQEVLGLEKVGRDDHFFHLGGNSIKAMRLILAAKDYRGKLMRF